MYQYLNTQLQLVQTENVNPMVKVHKEVRPPKLHQKKGENEFQLLKYSTIQLLMTKGGGTLLPKDAIYNLT